ncbi:MULTISPECIES: hypothetical protein [Pseudomonas]|uniref:Predicted membrane protein n=1 Tax=Pseudomonas luteola TaxID=47886 RepID=A0A2X2DC05_PSELU|nr:MULTISPECIES: hypothetical protein [Pseudomonas]ENA29355.1 hypothetical protein HMPREF1487_08348 [Pseudomonas sp. HPB0071]MBA1246116.1 hypothetical protein [Pseudomonas zeshuii]MBF8642789.1 hypothetical protein [Pseudomonas zeshuii]MBW5413624.1 hypothetical protein [Pseudomonas sp. MAG002Y]QEU26830.1 hypothetical protein FOB45_03100 [Pseudomonas luteola]
MPLLKLLHFLGLIGWCGSLLYLPGLLMAQVHDIHKADRPYRSGTGDITSELDAPVPALQLLRPELLRYVFTLIATPCALVAIISGTLLFIRHSLFDPWLILKLSLVAVMVVGHALCGALILKSDNLAPRTIRAWSIGLAVALSLAIGGTLYLVLAKPGWSGA